ncbi:MAG TPA: SDR family oxidoreductase, partial [Acidimicrobiia bacterium]|nr:SDR family oxidoreductase [Acidimicrobiia bacterium]
MRTVCLTGSAGGIGAATRARLERDGVRVIGVDVRDAEVIADLGTVQGRAEMVTAVLDACGGVLDGVIAGAGIMGEGPTVASVNYFGAVATLEGLRPALAAGTEPRAVAISSNSATTTPALPEKLAALFLDGDEPAVRDYFEREPFFAYMASKLALARWVRRNAPHDEWIGAGISLNAVAPGVVRTPMTENDLEMIFSIPDIFPVPIGRPGRAEEIAALLAFLV